MGDEDARANTGLESWINPEVGLIIGGGACRCAFSVGVIKAFARRFGPEGGGAVPDVGKRWLPGRIFAVSGSGLNASELVACGWRAETVVKKWLMLEKLGSNWLFNWSYLRMGWRALNRASLFDNANLHRLIHGDQKKKLVIPGLDVGAVVASPVDLLVPVTDEMKGDDYEKEYVIFSNHDELIRNDPELWRAVIQAGASPPGIFDPVAIRGRMCSDAICVKFTRMIEAKVKTLFLVLNDFPAARGSWTPKSWLERLIWSHFQIHDKLTQMFLRYNLEHFQDLRLYPMDAPLSFLQYFRKKNNPSIPTPRFDGFGNKLPDIIVISPQKTIPGLEHLSFEPGAITAAIDHGAEMADSVLNTLGW